MGKNEGEGKQMIFGSSLSVLNSAFPGTKEIYTQNFSISGLVVEQCNISKCKMCVSFDPAILLQEFILRR